MQYVPSRVDKNNVVTLLLWKSTRFHDEKTLDHKSKLAHSENAQKMCCNANHRYCATHWKPETEKMGDTVAAKLVFVCRGHRNF